MKVHFGMVSEGTVIPYAWSAINIALLIETIERRHQVSASLVREYLAKIGDNESENRIPGRP